jgi:hypothetical protein
VADDGEPKARALLARPEELHVVDDIEARWSRRLAFEHSLPLYARTEMPLNLDPDRWSFGVEVREAELPPELFADLRELTPQALLRDLHRPVKEFFVTPEPLEGTQAIGRMDDELARVRESRKLEALPVVEPLTGAVREEQERRRAFLAAPWKPLRPDDAPRDKVRIYQGEEDEEFYVPDFSRFDHRFK